MFLVAPYYVQKSELSAGMDGSFSPLDWTRPSPNFAVFFNKEIGPVSEVNIT